MEAASCYSSVVADVTHAASSVRYPSVYASYQLSAENGSAIDC